MSDLSRAIVRARRQIESSEAPIRRAMRDAYRLAVQRIESELLIVAREIATEPLPLSWFDERGRFTRQGMRLFRQDRLRRLLPLVEAEMVQFSDQGVRLLREGQLRAVLGGAADAIEFMDAAGVAARPAFGVRVNVPAVERLVSAFQPGPVRDVLDRYGTRGAEVIERLMLQGAITGEGPRQVVKRIMGELDNGVTRARLDSLVRTTMMDSFRGSLFDQYGMAGLRKWRWVSAHGSRSCLACLAMSGRSFSMDTPFLARHTNCRCIPSPYVAEIPYETGPQWFARQSPEMQRAMMPSGDAYAAFQRGDVALKDFVGHRRSKVWGPSIVQLSGREALRRAS